MNINAGTKRVQVTLKAPADLVAAIDSLADDQMRSRHGLIIYALTQWMAGRGREVQVEPLVAAIPGIP